MPPGSSTSSATPSRSCSTAVPRTAAQRQPSSIARSTRRGSSARARSRMRQSRRRSASDPPRLGRRAWEDTDGIGRPSAGERRRHAMAITEQVRLGDASIAEVDPELWTAMEDERRRQHDKIELIASENYTAAAVLEAQGSWLTNKHAEGLPGKR